MGACAIERDFKVGRSAIAKATVLAKSEWENAHPAEHNRGLGKATWEHPCPEKNCQNLRIQRLLQVRRMKRMKLKTPTARFTSAALLLILAVSSFLLSSAVGSLSTPVAIGPGTRLIDIGGNYTEGGTGGRIVVRVLASFGGFPGDTPLSRVNVSIRGATSPALAALTFHTNSSGSLELTIDPGEYSVAVNDQRFHLSTAV